MMLSRLHAPVGWLVSGSMQGTHSSPWPQVSTLSRPTSELPDTSEMHWLRQTPCKSKVRILVVQSAGTYSLPAWMMGSGTQRPELGPASLHAVNALASEAGRLLVDTQCEGPYLQQPAPGSDAGLWPG